MPALPALPPPTARTGISHRAAGPSPFHHSRLSSSVDANRDGLRRKQEQEQGAHAGCRAACRVQRPRCAGHTMPRCRVQLTACRARCPLAGGQRWAAAAGEHSPSAAAPALAPRSQAANGAADAVKAAAAAPAAAEAPAVDTPPPSDAAIAAPTDADAAADTAAAAPAPAQGASPAGEEAAAAGAVSLQSGMSSCGEAAHHHQTVPVVASLACHGAALLAHRDCPRVASVMPVPPSPLLQDGEGDWQLAGKSGRHHQG